MGDQDLYDFLRIASVHAESAARAAKVHRPDLVPLIQHAANALSAAATSTALALPCLACGGQGCDECKG